MHLPSLAESNDVVQRLIVLGAGLCHRHCDRLRGSALTIPDLRGDFDVSLQEKQGNAPSRDTIAI